MPPVRRTAAPAPPPPPAGGAVNFGSEGFFSGGLGLPEGNYAVAFSVQMFQPTKKDGTPSTTPAFLAVMGAFYPIDPASGALIGEVMEHPFSCGTKAHESFVPSADGMGFDPVPNAKGGNMWNLSAFAVFFDSLKNAGLPPGLVTNSLEPLNGIWIHTMNVPESDEKKAFSKRARSKTGAASLMGGSEDEDRVRFQTVCTEILEGGKPWEGTGGIPEEEAPSTPAKVVVIPDRRGQKAAAAKPAVRAAAPAPVAEASDIDEETLGATALEVVSQVLGSSSSMAKVAFKTKVFEAALKTAGEDMAQLIQETYISQDETLKVLLADLGFEISGLMVKAKA